MKETEIIAAIRSHLTPSPRQRNRPFESDAELAEIGGRLLAFTMDEFSAEDGLSMADPALLGWDLAAATMSDLLAVGAEPAFLLHSLVAAPSTTREAIEALSAGLQEALDAFGAAALGGDVGTGGQWRYTGCAVGSFGGGQQPVLRRIPVARGVVVATGEFGDANVSAARGAAPPRFECRLAEARRLAAMPAACIDTSDGLARAVESLSGRNPDVRIVLDLGAVPYAECVGPFAAEASARPEALLFGSAGEYELVACVPEPLGRKLVDGGGFARIGTFDRGAEGGLYYQTAGREGLIAHEPLPDPRRVGDLAAYREQVIALTNRLFGDGA